MDSSCPPVKPRLVEPLIRSPGSWLDELPAVLWSLHTTLNRSTGFTPFFLVYGAEAVIPTDVEFDSPRVAMYTEAEAREAREDGVDLLEEARLLALSRSAIYQQGLRHYHSKKIKPLAFREATSSFDSSKSKQASTSCPLHGRAHSS